MNAHAALRTATTIHVEALNEVSALTSFVEEWKDLATNASEPNPFYEHWMLIPALAHLGDGDVSVVLIWNTSESGARILNGLIPVKRERKFHRLPLARLVTWNHIHCFLGVPLIRRGFEEEVLQSFFSWLDTSSLRGLFLELKLFSNDGPIYKAFNRIVESSGRKALVHNSYRRAIYTYASEKKDAWTKCCSGETRKKLRKKREKLEQSGTLVYELLSDASQLDSWLTEFFILEASGWKGKSGTAINLRSNEEEYYRRICRSAMASGSLLLDRFVLNGKPVAGRMGFRAGEATFLAKIAYDEQQGKFSPGVLLELEGMKRFSEGGGTGWVDSCADADHPTFRYLWNEGRGLAFIYLCNRSLLSSFTISLIGLAKSVITSVTRRKPLSA